MYETKNYNSLCMFVCLYVCMYVCMYVGDLLTVLITLDAIIRNNEQLNSGWAAFKSMVSFIRGMCVYMYVRTYVCTHVCIYIYMLRSYEQPSVLFVYMQ